MLPISAPPPDSENGEQSFQMLYAHLMADMADYTNNIDHLIWYSAVVLNMFMHIATYTPQDGHGKAQLREFDHKSQLQYYRSQGNHSHAVFFKDLTNDPDNQGTCRLPFNEGFIRLIASNDFSPQFCAEIKKIDPHTGYPKPEKKVNSYVMTKIAHAGARKNNFSALVDSMKKVVAKKSNRKKLDALEQKLRAVLPPTQSIDKLTHEKCTKRINALLERFKTTPTFQPDEKLLGHLLNYRTKRVQSLKEKINALHLNHIRIDDTHENITCLIIRLYPDCTITDDTYKEGVTNVLLSFFGGLLNHNTQKKGLRIHTERRQSFGALRPTLTDASCLTLRLSLGTEPTVFDESIENSLKQFDRLLGEFKFDQKTHRSVKKVFEYCKPIKEKKDGERKPREPDTYIRNIVRKDDRTLTTYQQAKAYIDKAYKSKASGDYLTRAMKNFLTKYVSEQTSITPPVTITPDHQPNQDDVVQTIPSPIIHLLQNTLVYAYNFAKNLEFNSENEPLQPFEHVYYHSLLKLFNKCQEAETLLRNIDRTEATDFYYQATLLTEDLLEYLISLDALQQIRAELKGEPIHPITELRTCELNYVKHALNVSDEHLQLFFTDSGQQAITTTLLTLSITLHGKTKKKKGYDGDIFLFGKSYYEVAEFIKDCRQDKLSLEIDNIKKAKIVFVDISQLTQIDLDACSEMQALVIDITHHPLLDQAILKQTIHNAREKGVLIALVESSLKHAQLGLDKYQAGKITIITPPDAPTLSPEARDLFNTVSEKAIDPAAASYLSMVNAICHDKQNLTPPASPVEAIPSPPKVNNITNHLMFKPNSQTTKHTKKLHKKETPSVGLH